MNKVITINLGGTAFQLEDSGYDALNAYLETAKARLQENPDRDEILSDIERAIADKFRAQLSAHKNVVLVKEVEAVLAEMGSIEDETTGPGGGTSSETSQAAGVGATANDAGSTASAGTPKRLYRILEGRQLSGVCNGIAAYLNIDPTIVRLAFIALTLMWGSGIVVYLIMAVVIPIARTPEEKAAATGLPSTAQDFIRRAKEGYYEAVKAFPDRNARREWKRRFKREMREWRASFHREWDGNTEHWRSHWRQHYAAHPGAALALPLFSLLHGTIIILWICALVSLLSTGALFGLALPAGLPVWVVLLVLFALFGMLTWPLKAARRAFYFGGTAAGAPWALFCVIDVFIWFVVVAALLWLATHYFPHARDAAHNLPTVCREMADSIRDWWHSR